MADNPAKRAGQDRKRIESSQKHEQRDSLHLQQLKEALRKEAGASAEAVETPLVGIATSKRKPAKRARER